MPPSGDADYRMKNQKEMIEMWMARDQLPAGLGPALLVPHSWIIPHVTFGSSATTRLFWKCSILQLLSHHLVPSVLPKE